jgi:hypothetical protein
MTIVSEIRMPQKDGCGKNIHCKLLTFIHSFHVRDLLLQALEYIINVVSRVTATRMISGQLRFYYCIHMLLANI